MKEKRWTEWTPFSYPFNLTQHRRRRSRAGSQRRPAGRPAHRRAAVRRCASAAAARAFESVQPIPMPDVSALRASEEPRRYGWFRVFVLSWQIARRQRNP